MSREAAADQSDHDGGAWRLLTALGLALVLSIGVFVLTSDGGDVVTAVADTAPPTDTTVPESAVPVSTTTTVVDAAPPAETGESLGADEPAEPVGESAELEGVGEVAAADALGGGDGAFGRFEEAAEALGFAAATQITNLGPTEIGFTSNFPTVNYSWQRIELEGPGLSYEGWLGTLNGTFVAVSPTWGDGSFAAGGQSLNTMISADGITWEQVGSYPLPENSWIGRVVSDGERVFAFVQTDGPARAEQGVTILSADDGVNWSEAQLPVTVDEDEHVHVQNAVAGPAGIAVAVGLESYPEEPPRVLVFEGYEVTLDYARGTYVLADSGSGAELLSGSLEDLMSWGGEGQRIWNPETGELITVVPWEVWERSWSSWHRSGSPLPIPIPGEDPGGAPAIEIEYDGYLISIDERAGAFSVTVVESGDQIAAGSLDELYQGPAPRFVDPDTGEVYLSVTWDEWYEAEERSWETAEYPEGEFYEYRSRTALLTSTDGETWALEVVEDGEGGHTSFLVATDSGFIAQVNGYSEFGDRSAVWTMVDGTWSSADTEQSELWLSKVIDTGSGLLGVGEGSGGPALWRSADGLAWSTEFAIMPQDDGSRAWLTTLADDESGNAAVLAVKERWGEYRPLVIEQDQYTATFDQGEYAVSVSETGSGESMLALTWQELETGTVSDVISWEDGVTTITLDNGDAMAITDDEAIATMDDLYRNTNEMGISVFLSRGATWVEAVVDVDGAMSSASHILLAGDNILIAGNHWGGEAYRQEGPVAESFVVIVGTPVGGS